MIERAFALTLLAACGVSPRAVPDAGPDAVGFDAECPAIDFIPTPTTPSIELLIDRSGSMATDIGGNTRFEAVREALVGPDGVVTTRQADAYFGASLYSSDMPCPTLETVARGRDNRDAIALLLANQTPLGETPTGVAIDRVALAFADDPPPQFSVPVIVLATDGAPNTCDGTSDGARKAIDAAYAAHAGGIRTFVLGIGEEATANHLQAMANAGVGVLPGEPDAAYYTAEDPQELAAAFDAVIAGVLTCELSIDGRVARWHDARLRHRLARDR